MFTHAGVGKKKKERGRNADTIVCRHKSFFILWRPGERARPTTLFNYISSILRCRTTPRSRNAACPAPAHDLDMFGRARLFQRYFYRPLLILTDTFFFPSRPYTPAMYTCAASMASSSGHSPLSGPEPSRTAASTSTCTTADPRALRWVLQAQTYFFTRMRREAS